MERQFSSNLIFDIGVSEGNDTAFYLAKGFDVIAIEADPVMYVALQDRFREFIGGGRLAIFNRAAAQVPGQRLTFLHNPAEQGLSSFYASRRTPQSVEYEIETITWPELTKVKGVPYYAKIDIEGGEPEFLRSIPTASRLPTYISAECSTAEPIHLLHGLGYRDFRLINQTLVNQFTPPDPPREGTFVPTAELHHWSGLFGKELPGNRWFEYSQIIDIYDRLHSLWLLDTLISGWFDVHACTHRHPGQ